MPKKFMIVMWLAAIPSSAFAYCSKPSEPYCSNVYGPFTDSWDFERCRDEMVEYQNAAQRYRNCTINTANEEIERIKSDAEDAIGRMNRDVEFAIDNFNRRTRQ